MGLCPADAVSPFKNIVGITIRDRVAGLILNSYQWCVATRLLPLGKRNESRLIASLFVAACLSQTRMPSKKLALQLQGGNLTFENADIVSRVTDTAQVPRKA
ncbi:hypothetical protein TNCV_2594021 [Trichonephila clavipes]|nr:hypothetical protein TNCV_2594021 [Trichonephila clavipes]